MTWVEQPVRASARIVGGGGGARGTRLPVGRHRRDEGAAEQQLLGQAREAAHPQQVVPLQRRQHLPCTRRT